MANRLKMLPVRPTTPPGGRAGVQRVRSGGGRRNGGGEAKASIYGLNCTARSTSELEKAWTVQALVREDGLSPVTGPLEGTNHKIQLMKRQAYGFRRQAHCAIHISPINLSCSQLWSPGDVLVNGMPVKAAA